MSVVVDGGLPLILGYLLGSIPFGLVITRLAGLGDIRAVGSGNIGATNVLRTGRKDLALATLLLDSGKAGLAYWLCYWLVGSLINGGAEPKDITPMTAGLIGGASAFIGHCFPVWLKFKGGKGVATFIGLLLASMWQVGLVWGALWLLTVAVLRMSSLAALAATALAPVAVWYFGYGEFAIGVIIAIAILIFWRHRANISRILAGTEPKIGRKKPTEAPPGSPG
ncbi:MAG: glycerol-3-phosphate 1-O-acyltransferase PlsY [Hyphomonadaceae bacterium]|nr:glycerol-3-phosphate 1-O-acyltransferase PlsY [Hyphomonadaceae bacterium]